jgi:hypothetical protein
MKEFKWQYSDEKILFKVKENLINFIFTKIWILFSFIVLISIIWIILYYFEYKILSPIFAIISIFLITIYYWFLYKNSFLYFTTRRIIKQIRNGIFLEHRKELKIMDIKSTMSNKKGFIQTIIRVWNIKIEWTEKESSIYFSWIKEYAEISNYIWRVIDYIKLNGHTDNIARYQDKKMRKNK